MATPIQPNHFDLSGAGIHVTYLTVDGFGHPLFAYHDVNHNETFSGADVSVLDDPGGIQRIVTVRIAGSIDGPTTTFSLVIPRVNLGGDASLAISAFGVTTMHRFSLVAPLNLGQLDSYHLVSLRGNASKVPVPPE